MSILKEGYLSKKPRFKGGQKPSKKTWVQRYFRLTSSSLSYFTSNTDIKPKGVLNLIDCSVTNLNPSDLLEFKLNHDDHVFKVHEASKNRVTLIRAPSHILKQDWIDDIQKSISQCLRDLSLKNSVIKPLLRASRDSLSAIEPEGRRVSRPTAGEAQTPALSDLFEKDLIDFEIVYGKVYLELNQLINSLPAEFADGKVSFSREGVSCTGTSRNRKLEGKCSISTAWLELTANFNGHVISGNGQLSYKDKFKYEGTFFNNAFDGQGTLSFPTGALFVGSWKNGKRSGFGTLLSSQGNKYEGVFDNGIMHGQGTVFGVSGTKYKGNVQRNAFHGKGLMVLPDGISYEGNFQNDHWHGLGILSFPGNREFHGEFEKGVPAASGRLKFADLSEYTGECFWGLRRGTGEMKWSNGCFYTGDWVQDTMEGKGVFQCPSEHVAKAMGFGFPFEYFGEFLKGKKHGKGTLRVSKGNGEILYHGNWEHDHAQGHGSLNFPNGDLYDGLWQNGVLEGKGVFLWSDGRKYDGEFNRGLFHGDGLFMNTLGQVFQGKFVKGQVEGKGELILPTGDRFDGEWSQNLLNGIGDGFFNDGSVYRGFFVDNTMGPFGSFYWPNGDAYHGRFDILGESRFVFGKLHFRSGNTYIGEVDDEGRPHGVGVMYWVYGERFEGEWSHGKRNGKGLMFTSEGTVVDGFFEEDKVIKATIREIGSNEERPRRMALEVSSSEEPFMLKDDSLKDIEGQFYDTRDFSRRYRKISDSMYVQQLQPAITKSFHIDTEVDSPSLRLHFNSELLSVIEIPEETIEEHIKVHLESENDDEIIEFDSSSIVSPLNSPLSRSVDETTEILLEAKVETEQLEFSSESIPELFIQPENLEIKPKRLDLPLKTVPISKKPTSPTKPLPPTHVQEEILSVPISSTNLAHKSVDEWDPEDLYAWLYSEDFKELAAQLRNQGQDGNWLINVDFKSLHQSKVGVTLSWQEKRSLLITTRTFLDEQRDQQILSPTTRSHKDSAKSLNSQSSASSVEKMDVNKLRDFWEKGGTKK